MIRLGTTNDIPQALTLLEKAHYAGPYGESPFSEVKAKELINFLLSNRQLGITIVSETEGKLTGFLGAIASDIPGTSARIASEILWWTEGAELFDGVKLFEAYEYWAKNIAKVDYIQTGKPTENERLGRVYSKMGYTKKEELWLLHL